MTEAGARVFQVPAGYAAAVDLSSAAALLVTGREVKAGGPPADPRRVTVVDGLDEVERALAAN